MKPHRSPGLVLEEIFPNSQFHLHDEINPDRDHNDDPFVGKDHEEEDFEKVDNASPEEECDKKVKSRAEEAISQESSAPLFENTDHQYQGADRYNMFGVDNVLDLRSNPNVLGVILTLILSHRLVSDFALVRIPTPVSTPSYPYICLHP